MECKHSVTYYGITNIIYKGRVIGAIDLWRCLKCKKVFAEEKQLGVSELAPEVGMPTIMDDEKWGVLVCKLKDTNDRWQLIKLKNNTPIRHRCIDKEIELAIDNYNIKDDKHLIFLPEEYINKEVSID